MYEMSLSLMSWNYCQQAWRREEGREGEVATQEHLTVCPAYDSLRVGRDLEHSYTDLISYFMELMVMRDGGK